MRAIRSARTRVVQRFLLKNQPNNAQNDMKMNGITRKIRGSTILVLRARTVVSKHLRPPGSNTVRLRMLWQSKNKDFHKKTAIHCTFFRGGHRRFRQEPLATPVARSADKTRSGHLFRTKIILSHMCALQNCARQSTSDSSRARSIAAIRQQKCKRRRNKEDATILNALRVVGLRGEVHCKLQLA